MDYIEKFKQVGVRVPEIVFPVRGIDLQKYAVIACDQYSAQPEYWDRVADFVGKVPSTLYYIMPEAWLGKSERAMHKELLSANMKFFLANKSLEELEPGMVYVERETTSGIRRGLVLALDLECYDYKDGSRSLIRATEKTVPERLPARVEIRKTAPLECPHVMVLVNGRIDVPLPEKPLYDFDLMFNAGHIKGWHITGSAALGSVADRLLELKGEADKNQDGMLFAVGDGNHSLAAAKANWENLKRFVPEDQREDHPARFALVELVDLNDPGLSFEPVHRLLMHVDPAAVQKEIGFDAEAPESIQTLQGKIDEWLKSHPEAELEYIHGAGDCKRLAAEMGDALAVVWDSFDRETLFSDVVKNGCLVRKSFSMGQAGDKRFYLEARRITRISKNPVIPLVTDNIL